MDSNNHVYNMKTLDQKGTIFFLCPNTRCSENTGNPNPLCIHSLDIGDGVHHHYSFQKYMDRCERLKCYVTQYQNQVMMNEIQHQEYLNSKTRQILPGG